MIYLLLRWLIAAAALLVAAYALAGIHVSGIYIALILALIIGFLNAVIRPLLIVLTLPLNVLTIGLFTFVINAFLFWFPSTFVEGFRIDNFWWAIAGSLVVSVVTWAGTQLLQEGSNLKTR